MKKTLSIIALTLVGLLAVLTIILALVPVNFSKGDIPSTYTSIVVYKNGENNTYSDVFDANKDTFNKLKKKINASSKDSVLSGLFSGKFAFSAEVTEVYSSQSSLNNVRNTDKAIQLDFAEDMTLTENGKAWKNSKKQEVTYRSLLFAVSNTGSLGEITVYVIDSGNDSRYRVTTLAKQHDLYKFIDELVLTGN